VTGGGSVGVCSRTRRVGCLSTFVVSTFQVLETLPAEQENCCVVVSFYDNDELLMNSVTKRLQRPVVVWLFNVSHFSVLEQKLSSHVDLL